MYCRKQPSSTARRVMSSDLIWRKAAAAVASQADALSDLVDMVNNADELVGEYERGVEAPAEAPSQPPYEVIGIVAPAPLNDQSEDENTRSSGSDGSRRMRRSRRLLELS